MPAIQHLLLQMLPINLLGGTLLLEPMVVSCIQELFAAAKLSEQILVCSIPAIQQKVNIDLHLITEVEDVLESCKFHFPACHNVLHNTMKKYIRICIHQHASTITSAKVEFS